MLVVVPDLIEMLKEEESEGSDILEASSKIIYDIVSEHTLGEIPGYIRHLKLDDYFSEKGNRFAGDQND